MKPLSENEIITEAIYQMKIGKIKAQKLKDEGLKIQKDIYVYLSNDESEWHILKADFGQNIFSMKIIPTAEFDIKQIMRSFKIQF